MDNDRFSRNIGLISPPEQEKLLQSKVAIAGTGTDGGLLAERLVRAGIGSLHLADPEVFEEANLNRQFGCDTATIGQNKAVVVGRLLQQINPDTKIEVFDQGVTEENISEFVAGAGIVVDEIEYHRFDLSLLLHREARKQGKLVYLGANVGWGANLFIFSPDGMTLEEYVGFPVDASLDDARAFIIPPEKFSPNIPPYWSQELLSQIIHNEIPIPSISPAAALVAALLSTAIIFKLAKNKEYGIVPRFTCIDLYTEKVVF
ncbi:MAG: ThiF family adenylyltransferase [Candidatus Andersenbacteria bacterium]|nr:ThiF family adenylyltransferase [Candidatus Andersenbacteria bacterium]MBI3251108.1 ThiF family adenylyltransferase [Candidatus Andersenbacteria bacterium]